MMCVRSGRQHMQKRQAASFEVLVFHLMLFVGEQTSYVNGINRFVLSTAERLLIFRAFQWRGIVEDETIKLSIPRFFEEVFSIDESEQVSSERVEVYSCTENLNVTMLIFGCNVELTFVRFVLLRWVRAIVSTFGIEEQSVDDERLTYVQL